VACTLRPARPDDLPAVLALWQDATEVASSADDLAGLTALLSRDAGALLLALDGPDVVGTLIVGWDGWRGSFYRLAVRPDHRRQGVARSLVAEAEARLAELGCRRVSLYAVQAHERAVAFWAAVGYTLDAQDVRFVRQLDRP
jgi:ribosomal protein S18 acetylase RimI-like enzyme